MSSIFNTPYSHKTSDEKEKTKQSEESHHATERAMGEAGPSDLNYTGQTPRPGDKRRQIDEDGSRHGKQLKIIPFLTKNE